jgi:hypothetical protein
MTYFSFILLPKHREMQRIHSEANIEEQASCREEEWTKSASLATSQPLSEKENVQALKEENTARKQGTTAKQLKKIDKKKNQALELAGGT